MTDTMYKRLVPGILILYIVAAIAFECTENTARISTMAIYLVFAMGLVHFIITKQFFCNIHCASLLLLLAHIFIMSFVNTNNMSLTIVYYYLTCTVLCVFGYNLFMYTDREKTISLFILAFILGTIILDIRVIQSYGGISGIFEFSSSGIHERRVGGDIINENTLGLYNANSFFCCLIMYTKGKKTRPVLSRVLLLISVVFVVMLLLTASKKAFVFLVVGFTLFAMFIYRKSSSKKKIAMILITALGVFALYYVLTQVPYFRSVKLRFEELFKTVSTDNEFVSETDQTRINMINEGLAAFYDSPIFGKGTGYSYTIFHNSYSHNNMVELLMNYGIIGFTIYYLPYVYILFKLIKLMRQDNMYAIYFFIFVLFHLALGVGWVNYYERVIQLFTVFAVGYIENYNKAEIRKPNRCAYIKYAN